MAYLFGNKCTYILLALILMFINDCSSSKYAEDKNRPGGWKDEKSPFRARKVTQVWEKANRIGLPEPKLTELKRSLKKLDDKFLTFKKDEKQKLDVEEVKEFQDILNKQLTDIMKRFGIIPSDRDMDYDPRAGQMFTDKRVNSLWTQALKNNQFNEEELAELRKELLSHQEKQKEFDKEMKMLHDNGQETNEVHDRDDRKFNRHPVDQQEERSRNLDMKLKHKELSREFQQLSVKVHPEADKGGFVESRVISLWKEAKMSNFTDEELESIKEELQHFEKKVIRSDDLHFEVLKSEKEALSDENLSIKDEELSKDRVKAKMKESHSLREEMREIGSQVANFMKSFKDRLAKVGRKHGEL